MLELIEDNVMVKPDNDTTNIIGFKNNTNHLLLKQKYEEQAEDFAFTDEITFCDTLKQLQILKESIQGIPEINQARVLYFKEKISSGNYRMSNAKIAASMLNTLELEPEDR